MKYTIPLLAPGGGSRYPQANKVQRYKKQDSTVNNLNILFRVGGAVLMP